MYTGKHAHLRPLQPAFIMAGYRRGRDLSPNWRRAAIVWRICFASSASKRLDHYAIFMENNSRYLEACGAGERSGLYYTCVNSYLTPSELAYIVNNSESARSHHVSGKARRRAARRSRNAPRSSSASLPMARRKRAHRRPARSRRAGCPRRRSRTNRVGTAMLYLVRHHRPAERHPAPAAGAAADAAAAAVRFPAKALAVPRRHDLSVAGAALSCGAAGRGQSRRSGAAAPSSSWRASIRSVISSWSRNGASPTASWCRRCSRAC